MAQIAFVYLNVFVIILGSVLELNINGSFMLCIDGYLYAICIDQ